MLDAYEQDRVREEAEDDARLNEQREIDDFLWLMNDKRGRRMVWRWLSDAGIYRSIFATHGGVMNFNEGRRDFGLKLLSKINTHCPELYPVMVTENQPKEVKQNDD